MFPCIKINVLLVSKQVMLVGNISYRFNVTNGVCQGGILSPNFFNVHIDRLSNILN